MRKPNGLWLVAIALLAGFAGACVAAVAQPFLMKADGVRSPHDDVYDRVMRTQTIRCGYGIWPPLLNKDLNSGELSGIFYDYVEELGKALKLKIVWAEEIGGADFAAALKAERVDGMCYSIWPGAARARELDFTAPVYYVAQYAYVRADDKRFDNNVDSINDPSVTVVTVDGNIDQLIAASDFPKAKSFQLTGLASQAELFANVVAKKADVAIADNAAASNYMAHNPGKIRRLAAKAPLRVFGNTIAIAQGQDRFRRMLNTATQELLDSGKIDRIIAKYEEHPGDFLRVAPGYRISE
ncbi:MAG: transporter substrate-binding domain-containing protein [Alphaproteobacteria bacterium]|nr:transporter substrate-binding domain-containing protein [Alphaproteobacteria bacterium]